MNDTTNTTKPAADSPAAIENRIRTFTEKVPGLRFGYIGNIERWGDDRRLHIWVEGHRHDNGNPPSLCRCEARALAIKENASAWHAVNGFKIGRETA